MRVCAGTFVTSSPCNLIEMLAEPYLSLVDAARRWVSRFTPAFVKRSNWLGIQPNRT